MGSRAAAAATALRKTADLALRTSLHDHETSGHGLGTRKTFKHHADFSIGTRGKNERQESQQYAFQLIYGPICQLSSDLKLQKKKKKKATVSDAMCGESVYYSVDRLLPFIGEK